jgi:hypothetical protein
LRVTSPPRLVSRLPRIVGAHDPAPRRRSGEELALRREVDLGEREEERRRYRKMLAGRLRREAELVFVPAWLTWLGSTCSFLLPGVSIGVLQVAAIALTFAALLRLSSRLFVEACPPERLPNRSRSRSSGASPPAGRTPTVSPPNPEDDALRALHDAACGTASSDAVGSKADAEGLERCRGERQLGVDSSASGGA